MQVLKFITQNGVCGHTCEWDEMGAEYDAVGWLASFGHRIGSGATKLPDGNWIDLSQFASVVEATPNE